MSGASERANGGANGPVLYASISYHFKPPWDGAMFGISKMSSGETERDLMGLSERVPNSQCARHGVITGITEK